MNPRRWQHRFFSSERQTQWAAEKKLCNCVQFHISMSARLNQANDTRPQGWDWIDHFRRVKSTSVRLVHLWDFFTISGERIKYCRSTQIFNENTINIYSMGNILVKLWILEGRIHQECLAINEGFMKLSQGIFKNRAFTLTDFN